MEESEYFESLKAMMRTSVPISQLSLKELSTIRKQDISTEETTMKRLKVLKFLYLRMELSEVQSLLLKTSLTA